MLSQVLSRLNKVKRISGGYTALCPAHDDKNPSLSISQGDDGRILLHCHAGCSFEKICDSLGIKPKDLFPKNENTIKGFKNNDPIIATYDYYNAKNELLYQVCRTAKKNFFQRRPDGNGGWVNGLGNVKRVLYKLPEIQKAIEQNETVFFVEGEKDVDSLINLGLVATTNPMGAGKWHSHYNDLLRGTKEIILIPDNDEVGKKHMQKVARNICGKVENIKILELPDLGEGEDISDWLECCGSKQYLLHLVAGAPEWENKKTKNKELSQADKLIQIAIKAFLFHDQNKNGFASIQVHNHRENWQLESKIFKQWLVKEYYKETGKSPTNETLRQALNLIEAKAIFDGPEVKLNLRVAKEDDAVWYDLGNDKWQAVKITSDDWKIVDNPPVIFQRYANTASQVLPKKMLDSKEGLKLLKNYINLKEEDDWHLLYASIVHAFIPDVPHPVLIFHGDKGSAKTTAQRVIRKLIDPAVRDTMSLPKDTEGLALTLTTNYAPTFDNLDRLQPWQSDMLCQAATGGGIIKRKLYTDMEEVILSFLRCPMLNGINIAATRDDLLDRSLLFKLDRIDEGDRKTESEFWQEFEIVRPYILGEIFTVLSNALKIYNTVELPILPRMADFGRWAYTITEAICEEGHKFIKAYRRNISQAVEEAIFSDVTSAAIAEFMNNKDTWEGTPTELLRLLNGLQSTNTKTREWPKHPHILTRKLNAARSVLIDFGILVENGRTSNNRLVRLTKIKA